MIPQLLVYDFDGVMTDNTVYVSEEGIETVRVNRGDGLAVSLFKSKGLPQLILTTEANPVVTQRAKKLAIDILSSIQDKAAALKAYCAQHNIPLNTVLFIGNDLNDLGVMKLVGMPVCPSDAAQEIKAISRHILTKKGGEGCIRELWDYLALST